MRIFPSPKNSIKRGPGVTGTEMPADALSRQAHRETKGPIPVAASSIMEALPEAMSDLHWKYE